MKQVLTAASTAAVTSLAAVTNLASAAAKLTHAADTLAGVADSAATQYADVRTIKNQIAYNAAKSDLDKQMEALGLTA